MSTAIAKSKNASSNTADNQQTLRQLYESIRKRKAKLVRPNGEALPVPDSLRAFLEDLSVLLNEKRSAHIIQNEAKLTTIEAAAMIGVSRQFLIGLLESNEIPFHMVGTHRRVYVEDLLRYKTERDQTRGRILGELARAEADEGIYGRSPAADED